MRLRLSVIALVSAALLLAGCTDTSEPVPPSASPTAGPVGRWQEADTEAFLELDEDGKLLAFDGCNTLQGSWHLDGTLILLDFDGGTERGCDDIPNVWLSLAATATQENTTLVLSDGGGAEIGQLTAGDD